MSKPRVNTLEDCKTLFQAMVVQLRNELGVSNNELADSMGINRVTFYQWQSLKTFPQSEGRFNVMANSYPIFRKYRYMVFKRDFNEYLKNPKRPTLGLRKYLSGIGYDFSEETQTFTKRPEPKKETISEFKGVLNKIQETSKEGLELVQLLTEKIGEIPNTVEVDFNVMKSEEQYKNTMEDLADRLERTMEIRNALIDAQVLLKRLYLEYKKIKRYREEEKELAEEAREYGQYEGIVWGE